MTLWGEYARQKDGVFKHHPVVSMKGVQCKAYNSSLDCSLGNAGLFVLNGDSAMVRQQQKWWLEGGSSRPLTNLSPSGGAGSSLASSSQTVKLADIDTALDGPPKAPILFEVKQVRLLHVQTMSRGARKSLAYSACQNTRYRGSLGRLGKTDQPVDLKPGQFLRSLFFVKVK